MLIVPPQESEADLAQEPELGRILIPLDGSQLAEQILEPAVALAGVTQTEVTLLRVVEQLTPATYDPESNRISGMRPALLKQLQDVDHKERTRAEDYLGQIAERLRARSFSVQTRVVSHIRPATAILDDVSAHDVDLIALATHGRGGLKRLLVGSVADKVVRVAMIPVLVYRPVGELAAVEE
jgi:nucleotide-binding universal stress UspA family protein